MKKKIKNNKGFTLVELLAVIVVLAVIMVIAGTSIINVINKNNANAFVSNARVAYSVLKQCKASDLTADECQSMIDQETNDYTITVARDASSGVYTYTLTAKTTGKFKSVASNLSTYYKTGTDCSKITNAGVGNAKTNCGSGTSGTIKGSY